MYITLLSICGDQAMGSINGCGTADFRLAARGKDWKLWCGNVQPNLYLCFELQRFKCCTSYNADFIFLLDLQSQKYFWHLELISVDKLKIFIHGYIGSFNVWDWDRTTFWLSLISSEKVILCPSLTVPNLLPNEDECKKFEIRVHSSLSKRQIFFFSVGHGSFSIKIRT